MICMLCIGVKAAQCPRPRCLVCDGAPGQRQDESRGSASKACTRSAARVWGLGMFGVAGAIMAGWTLKNAIFAPLYTAHILRRPLLTFLPGLLPGVGSALAVTGLAWSAARLLPYSGWTQVLLGSVATSLAYLALLFALVLTPEEKGLLRLRITRSL